MRRSIFRSFSAASRSVYESPLSGRYASAEMLHNWSPDKKFGSWRRLWLALATAQHELGLNVTREQLQQLEQHVDDINYEEAQKKEREIRHDVMAHIHAYGVQCPDAAPIIHLGATSCYVGDNTDLIQMADGLDMLLGGLLNLIALLRNNAMQHRTLPTLGFTHYQPAQLTTVGKRISLWLQDFLFDFHNLHNVRRNLRFRGVKGTTGTQASFMALFNNDHDKVRKLDARVAELMGFERVVAVSGQTYTRKQDYFVLSALSGVAQSASKMGADMRLLMNLKEMEEPWGAKQVGSSAMAYKRNPMRSERMCSLARWVISVTDNAAQTHANQWLERTLDDSANRRLSLPESFLATDAVIRIAANIANGLQVWPHVIEKHIKAELPFMATENILMEAVEAGGHRGDLHEVIREHSMEAGRQVKEFGKDNDLLERIKGDPAFSSVAHKVDDMMDPQKFVGRAPQQVEDFVAAEVDPVLEEHAHLLRDAKPTLNI